MTELATKAQQGGPSQTGATGQTTTGPSTRKLDASEANFQKAGGISNLRCGDCSFYADGACQIVDVTPAPDDVCDEFQPATQVGHMSASEALSARSLVSGELFIQRVSRDPVTGIRRWKATSSGVKKDLYGERMSTPLYEDFLKRIKEGSTVPEPFSSRAWSGGNPYLGVAHYLDLDGFGILGPTERMWIDGSLLKARGRFNDSPLADKAFDSIQSDIRDNRADNERIRISIAFLDWAHRHGDGPVFERRSLLDRCPECERGVGEKEYLKGQLIHLATTRRPAYPETEIVAMEARSMSRIRDDAASIVGDEMADELEKRASLTKRSAEDVAPGVVVVRENEQPPTPPSGPGRPFGGAVTLDEAESYLQKSGEVLLDEWSVLAGVLANLSARSEGDKGKAIREALREFQQTLDVKTARALVNVERIVGGKSMTEPVTREMAPDAPPEETDEERRKREKAEAEEYEEPVKEKSLAATHALDPLIATFRSAYDGIMASPGTAQEKLIALQEPFNDFGNSLKQSIHAAIPDSTEEVVKRAVNEAMAPLLQKIAALESAPPPTPPVPPTIPILPVRRAVRLSPSPANSPIIARSDPVPPRVSETPKLQNLIRKSVYMR